jgi:alpha-N-acetylglucosaminidase
LITLWGDGRSRLHDYSGRHWAGLVATFYMPRWRRWAEYLHECLVTNRDPDEESFTTELIEWEERWCSGSQDGERWEGDCAGQPAAIASSLMERFVAKAGA